MRFLHRLFANRPDPRDEVRALWAQVIAEARDPAWYRDCGVADTLEGRFDMVTADLCMAPAVVRFMRYPRSPRLAEAYQSAGA